MSLESYITRAWYRRFSILLLLFPFSLLFGLVARIKRSRFLQSKGNIYKASVPVVVLGNITVGGTGKSPLIAYLAEALKNKGYTPGIVCSGYGASISRGELRAVNDTSTARDVGDEPLMLKKMTGCHVVAAPLRAKGINKLEQLGCNMVLCDDGMQHYRFQRDIEICLLDSQRGLGNGLWLPAGPLRESRARLQSVDLVVCNGGRISGLKVPESKLAEMRLKAGELKPLGRTRVRVPDAHSTVHAVAGIGNPSRFFATLKQQGFNIVEHEFPDHHEYDQEDLKFDSSYPIIMTEKDAVKCAHLELENAWYLPVRSKLNIDLVEWLLLQLSKKGLING